jgi:short-subunit dehydrogenase
LAMNNINVVLVARNEIKLKEKVAEIKKLYKVKAEYRVADFGKGKTPEFYTKLNETMEDLDVSILVNNVGMGEDQFHKSDVQGTWNLGIINMVPQFMMTKVFLPRFKSRTSRSCVIDLSSIASLAEMLNVGFYGATKAFNRAFSQNMGEKFGSEFGIDFLTIKPGYVLTNIQCEGDTVKNQCKNKADNFWSFTIEDAAENYIKCMGNVTETYGSHHKLGGSTDAFIWMTSAIQVTQILRMFGFKR